jgi:hypothetical protein
MHEAITADAGLDGRIHQMLREKWCGWQIANILTQSGPRCSRRFIMREVAVLKFPVFGSDIEAA